MNLVTHNQAMEIVRACRANNITVGSKQFQKIITAFCGTPKKYNANLEHEVIEIMRNESVLGGNSFRL